MHIVEHLTHKAGKFVFSSLYDAEAVEPRLTKARVLYSTVSELPILPNIAAKLKEDLVRRSIFGTAAIEGNALTEDEVGAVLTKTEEIGAAGRGEREIENLKLVYALLTGKKSDAPWRVDEGFVKAVHEQLTKGIEYHHNSPGKYRNEPVLVGNAEHGGIYTPPKILDDIKDLMRLFVDWVNHEDVREESPMIRAGLAHYHLAKIHPFQDGNGRTARFLEAMVLDQAGVKFLPEMMSNYYYRNIDDYFIAFSKTHKTKDKRDVTPFLVFFLDGVVQSLEEIKSKITLYIRILTLRNFYYSQKREKKLTKRQRDLLLVAIDAGLSFTLLDLFSTPLLRSLYSDVSESTARRDLKKLFDNGYLLYDESGKKYSVNLRALG